MAVTAEGGALTVIHVGSCQLWIMREQRLYPLVSEPALEPQTTIRNLRAGDRILAFSAVVADAFSPAELEHLLLTEPSDVLVSATLLQRTALPGHATIVSAACMTQPDRSDRMAASRPMAIAAPPHIRALAPPAVAQPSVAPIKSLPRQVARPIAPPPVPKARLPVKSRRPAQPLQPPLILIGLLAISMVVLCALLLALALPSVFGSARGLSTPKQDSVGITRVETQIVLPPTLTPLPSSNNPTPEALQEVEATRESESLVPIPTTAATAQVTTSTATATLTPPNVRAPGAIAEKAKRNIPQTKPRVALTPSAASPSRGIPAAP